MKKTILNFILLTIGNVSIAQIDPEFYIEKVEFYHPGGLVILKPDAEIKTGETFTVYKENFIDYEDSEMKVRRTKYVEDDNFLHLEYQQYYKGIPVEGANVVEHSIDSMVHSFNGQICLDIDKDTNNLISPEEAIGITTSLYGDRSFGWEDEEFEFELKFDLDNSEASFYPSPTLVWALNDDLPVSFLIQADRYTLCYAIEIHVFDPYEHEMVFVNAKTGEILRVTNLIHYDGPADVIGPYATQTIDTKSPFLNSNYQLIADGSGRNIETRSGSYFESWGDNIKVEDEDDDWVGHPETNAISAHWAMTEAWRAFKNLYNRDGLKDNGKRIRINANSTKNRAVYQHRGIRDYIEFGRSQDGTGRTEVIDIAGHEFCHGVNYYEGQVGHQRGNSEESAIKEGFCDIFGFITEFYFEGKPTSGYDWTLGEDGGQIRRDMKYPNNYDHPDTYQGPYWYTSQNQHPTDDYPHTNNGPLNKWFQLLVDGGTHNGVTVTRIGFDLAAQIAYRTFESSLTTSSGYLNTAVATYLYSSMKFGTCHTATIAVLEAWLAIGIPFNSPCGPLQIEEQITKAKTNYMYFNKNENFLVIRPNGIDKYQELEIYSVSGQLIHKSRVSHEFVSMNFLSSGLYIAKLINSNSNYEVLKFVR